MSRLVRLNASALLCVLLSIDVCYAEGQNKVHKASKTLAEISIIGNTELPNVSFDLPWKLPSIAKRAEEKPIDALTGMLEPIEPERHRQQVFFDQHLKLDMPKF